MFLKFLQLAIPRNSISIVHTNTRVKMAALELSPGIQELEGLLSQRDRDLTQLLSFFMRCARVRRGFQDNLHGRKSSGYSGRPLIAQPRQNTM